MKKRQLNARLPEPLRRATRTVAAHLNWKVEEIAEVAYSMVLGSTDELIQAKQRKIEEAAKRLRVTFNLAESQMTGLAA